MVFPAWLGKAIGGDDISHAMCFISGDVGLNAYDAKPFCAAQRELVVCTGRDLVCIFIFACNKLGSIED